MDFLESLSPLGKRAFVLLLFLCLMLQFGCSSQPTKSYFFDEPQQLILGPGDIVNIQFSYSPELNAIQAVRHDGKIALQLIGEVEVTGLTPLELQNKLIQLYSKQLKLTEITVTVDSFYSNRVYVSGAVGGQGFLDFPGRMTAFEAVIMSGGFDLVAADVKNVLILRYENGIRRGYKLNFEPVIEGKESPAFFLQPFDVVYVPEKPSVKIARWIDQHIDGMIPGVLASSAMIGFLLTR